MTLNTWFFDFETYYDKDYSLRKMTPVEYILDPRFEAIGCAVKESVEAPAYWVDGVDLPKFFAGVPQETTIGVSHNWLFDGCVLAWRYGWAPKLAVCTMSVSRAVLGHLLRSVSLESVSKHLGLPPKGNTVHKMEGMTPQLIREEGLYDEYVAYSKRDDENCALIYDRLVRSGKFPVGELAVMDMVMRTCTQPRFVLDRNLLHAHLGEVLAEKENLMARISADKDSLMSNDKFAGLLRDMGVDPPMKISPATGNETYAFAKSDPAFLDLAEHDDPAVQALVEARLGAKSTLEETRTKRFISISQLEWTPQVTSLGNPLMPMPIRYSAAHTHRLGGDWKLNVQNLRRGGKLRRALTAPDGCSVMTVDASQIEGREVVTFSGQDDVVEQFERGEDTYANLATEIFGFPVNKKDHPDERFVGKQARLGLGYQLWWPKFQSRVKTDSKNQTGKMIILSDQQALNAVTTFRRLNDKVCDAWNLLNTEGIGVLAHGGKFEFAACVFTKGEIALPNGLKLHYHDLRQEYDKKKGRTQWMFTYAGKPEGIYGGKLMENLMQSLAAVHTYSAAIRIQKRSHQEFGQTLYLAQQAHDENVFIVPDELVERMRVIMLEEMRWRPDWAPKLPLDAEVGVGKTYGEAK